MSIEAGIEADRARLRREFIDLMKQGRTDAAHKALAEYDRLPRVFSGPCTEPLCVQ